MFKNDIKKEILSNLFNNSIFPEEKPKNVDNNKKNEYEKKNKS